MTRYIKYWAFAVLCILITAASLSYFVDPAGIYHGQDASRYPSRLISSANGLSIPDGAIDEREAARMLASHGGAVECVIVGSSHVMQVSSERKDRSLSTECPTLLNLGVSGGAIEDHIAIVWRSLSGIPPRKVVLGIDPWLFMYGRDSRWTSDRAGYQRARNAIFEEDWVIKDGRPVGDLALNLINGPYVARAIDLLLQRKALRQYITQAPPVDLEKGADHPIRLRDGSLVYSARYIRESHEKRPSGCGVSYGTRGYHPKSNAVSDYRQMIRWIKKRGVQPILLITPYHQSVFECPDSDNMRAMRKTMDIIWRLAKEEHIPVLGSYDPDVVGCHPEDFYDFMHPKARCLAKIGG